MVELNEKLRQDNKGALYTMLFLFLLSFPSAFWTGFVLSKLYNWFVLPIQGAPVLSIGNMLGIALIVNLLLYNMAKQSDDTVKNVQSWSEAFSATVAKMLFIPAGFLFFGWLYQLILMR
ncbi:MAG: hypothetical protein EKK63_11050 [Acinetobacter sp.]|uniref:hypothetical protein n=1 Tax=Acinetobacter sp. TaxID=472 RepID=UPI000F9B376B|nr:hypothetical protein [Acinetobacter sp.]RUP38899.1 MAG: hypothetical protein EKK63_11050 [Acinetobacter sp.]